MNNDQKLCEITDIIPVRIFPDRAKKLGPIKPMLMSNSLIYSILNSRPAPKHFFALNPNNTKRKILLTKNNYDKTSEELFGTNKETNATTNINNDEKLVINDPIVDNKNTILNSNDKLGDSVSVKENESSSTSSQTNIDNTNTSNEIKTTETIIDVNDIDISNNIETDNQYKSKKNKKNK